MTTTKVIKNADERRDLKKNNPVTEDAVQKRALNEVYKTEKEKSKVIVREDGTVQVVGIDETNVEDEHPNLNPVAEITPDVQDEASDVTSEEALTDGTEKTTEKTAESNANKTAVHEEVKENTQENAKASGTAKAKQTKATNTKK